MRVIGIIICLAIFWHFSHQLLMQCQIRGWLPGAHVYHYTISEKWIDDSKFTSHYKVRWHDDTRSDFQYQLKQTTVSEEFWQTHNPGDIVEVVRIGNNDEPYSRSGIWSDNSNISFNLFMVIAALLGIPYLVFQQRIHRTCQAWRARLNGKNSN